MSAAFKFSAGRSLRHTALAQAIVCILLFLPVLAFAARHTEAWNNGWEFHLGNIVGAESTTADPRAWTPVTLPHDWSIGLEIDPKAPGAGNVGYYPGGIGWYQRHFSAPVDWAGQQVTIEFEGAYMNAQVWLNGVSLGQHPYGYTPFSYDLTPYLRLGRDNILSVRIDNSVQPNSRWYTGSGLYRHVWLQVTDPVHVPDGGLNFSTRELSSERAAVVAQTTVRNQSAAPVLVEVETEIVDPTGHRAALSRITRQIGDGESADTAVELQVARPQVWSPDTPALYEIHTRLRERGRLVDERVTPFGIRTLRVSAAAGLELNGSMIKLLGGSVHHDDGLLGAAAFDRAEERKVQLLKDAGFNAVRTAHNPPSTAFLNACDRLGLLVIDEIFDGWEKAKTAHDYSIYFANWWESDVRAWVRRDRNHPSVIAWSVGNEMFERGNAEGRRIARELTTRIREMDTTRPLTAGVNNLGANGDWTQLDPLFSNFDIAGYNYQLAQAEADHARVPDRVIMATESYQTEAFANWRALETHSYIVGDFVWSALDYLGEAGIGRVFPPGEPAKKHWEAEMYPWHSSYSGDIDLTGWRKPSSHYRKIVWDRGERLYLAVVAPAPGGGAWNVTPWSMPPALPSWTWPGRDGTPMTVEVYSRYDAVRLLLNGQVVGEQPTTMDHEFRAKFNVPFSPGELRVVGLSAGRESESFILRTAAEATGIRLSADHIRINAGGQDLAFITAEAVDPAGNWNPTATNTVHFTVTGAATLAAAGTGSPTDLVPYTKDTHTLFQGRAMVIVRAGARPGNVTVEATAPGLAPVRLSLTTVSP